MLWLRQPCLVNISYLFFQEYYWPYIVILIFLYKKNTRIEFPRIRCQVGHCKRSNFLFCGIERGDHGLMVSDNN